MIKIIDDLLLAQKMLNNIYNILTKCVITFKTKLQSLYQQGLIIDIVEWNEFGYKLQTNNKFNLKQSIITIRKPHIYRSEKVYMYKYMRALNQLLNTIDHIAIECEDNKYYIWSYIDINEQKTLIYNKGDEMHLQIDVMNYCMKISNKIIDYLDKLVIK